MPQHFDQTHHRQSFQRHQAVQTLSNHPRPADTTEARLGIMRPQRRHQVGAEQIAR